ncbi:helix-turn-helix domain-containing protein [Salegentibacter sp. F188]|uniref:Helix-turn-helix domain-containing protein n=1 Tax=Autumnicola patrickiae TaxID=3075591 RepID=A0ABU3E4Z4_9FLAO|nr:helix-turn-helix domain-containing protein [Salegentibacter sp. F188]MDT0691072.1 helix-turn-helix domain-containing protein [Salegentibacter sp. F188]
MAQIPTTYKSIFFYLMFVLSGTISFIGYSQDIPSKRLENVTTKLSYEEIQDLEYEALIDKDTAALGLLIKIHLRKASLEKNNIEKARAYYYKTTLEKTSPALVYADSIIKITKESTHPNYPAIGYAIKGHLHYESGNFQVALTNYLKAYNLALTKENVDQQREFALAIAAIRNLYGQHYAAVELYNKYLKLLKNEENFETQHYDDYTLLLFNLTLTHLRLQSIDSARFYANQGIKLTSKLRDDSNFQDFILLDAQINYYDSSYDKARDTLLKYNGSLDGTSKAIKLYYLGKIEDKLNNKNLSIKYFKEIDSIVTATGDPFPEVKDVYHELILNSIDKDDKHGQIEYIGKLIAYDSLHSTKQENVINAAMASYDIPYLKHQKREAEAQLENKRTIITGVGLLAGLGSFTGIFFFVRSIRIQRKLKVLLEEGIVRKKIISDQPVGNHASSVPEDIKKDILNKLEKFENSERFLDKELDMSKLAQELETNTSYLSVIINSYKGKTFPNYLKDIRIAKAVRMLNNDHSLLRFSNQGLAEVFGFKTSESFSKAFYKNTGIYPSKFIKELNLRKVDGHL